MDHRILIGSDDSHDVATLVAMIDEDLNFEVVGAVSSPVALEMAVKKFNPTIVLLRLTQAMHHWRDVIAELNRTDKRIGIIALTDDSLRDDIISMLKAGINAILPLNTSAADLQSAIRETANGKMFIPARRANGG